MSTFADARAAGHLAAAEQGTNPQTLADELDGYAARLDELEKDVETATNILNDAEDAWLVVWDAVAETLRDEYQQAGRKGDPAEHTIESVARRENRVAYTNWRRAKRAVDMLDKQIRAVTAGLTAKQSRNKIAGAEASMSAQPASWSRAA